MFTSVLDPVFKLKSRLKKPKRQGGYTFIELTVVLIIIAVLALLAYPKIRSYLIEGRVKPTADDVVSAVTRIRANAEGTGNTPYASITTATLANSLRDRSTSLPLSGTGATSAVQHKLGATGSQVTTEPATITNSGDSFTVTVPTANNAACPSLATSLQNNAEIISINGTVVKSTPAGTLYNGQTAQDLCTADDTNTFVFTFR